MRRLPCESARHSSRPTHIAASLTLVVLAACSDSNAASPSPRTPEAQIQHGHDAFIASCAGCHSSRDAFDIAFFGFADSTIVRRASKHVSAQTGRDIASYVRTLDVTSRGETFRPFQPTGFTAGTDGAFWVNTVGGSENDWPANLTPEMLRSIDMRTIAAPLALPIWSDETDDDDWMPDVPLDPKLLDANGGTVRRLIDAYYASPSDATLIAAVNAFRQLVRPATGGTDALCYGDTGAQPRAADCFQAMRWMSSLAAVHFLRRDRTEQIPLDIVHLWWETGEAAVSEVFVPPANRDSQARRLRTAGWLYLAFTYAPMEFREENGYLGQFLQGAGLSRLAMFADLRRMVGTGGVHDRDPALPVWDAQPFWDGALAVVRAPNVFTVPAAQFVVDYLISSIDAGATYRPEARQLMTNALKTLDGTVSSARNVNASQRDQLAARRAVLDSKIPSAIRP